MYRRNQRGGFKSPLIRSEENNDPSPVPGTTNGSRDAPTAARTTSQILNLFKKTATSISTEETSERVHSESIECVKNDCNDSSVPVPLDNNKLMFNVVIGKKSTRKHKKWDDDGILEVNGKRAVLKDTDGNVLHRTTVNPANLTEGYRIYVDNKEVEIVDRIQSDSAKRNPEPEEVVEELPRKKFKPVKLRPVGPMKALGLTYYPLVMPSLSGSRGWLERSATKGVPEQEVSVDSFLVNVLRPHQRRGVVFLYECLMGIKVANHYGAILADEMGLGKTLQCITVIWTMLRKGPYGEPVVKRVLVVTPSSLCDNWNAEFTRWLGSHRISPYVVDGKRRRAKDFTKQPRNTVMIISYDTLIRNREDIEGMSFNLVVCDEGHRLKNCDVKAAKFLRGMACRRRVLLTGTPIQNDLQEFFALVDLVNPGILGTSQSYKTEYETPIVASRSPSATNVVVETGSLKARQLHDLTKPFTLRRTQDTIDKYMPSKHEIVVLCRLSQEQERLYKLVTDSWFRNVVLPGNNVPHLTVITSLKKICNHVDLFTTGEMEFFSDSRVPEIGKRKTNEYCGKVTIVRTLMRSLKGTDEKLVLVSYYTKTLDLLEVVCNGEGLPFLRLDGSTVTAVRSKIVAQFNSATNDHKVFLLSGKAGGVGLNLPGGSRLVLFDSDWNPASDAQAMARIWREGQKRDVYIYRLLTTGTIEEKIFQRQISKTGLSETIVDQNSFDSLKFSLDELRDLFTLTTETNCLTHDLMKCRCEGKGRKREERSNDELELEEERDCQFLLQERPSQPNITINQLLEWEHYERPISQEVMKDIMLDESAGHVSFLFKNSRLRRNRD